MIPFPARSIAAAVAALSTSAFESLATASSSVLYVDGTAVAGGDGLTWATAISSLDAALSQAFAAGIDELWVREGVYVPTIPSTADPRSKRFFVPPGVLVRGGFAGTERAPEERDIEAHPTVLSGDILGNDGPNLTNRADNTYRIADVLGGVNGGFDGVIFRGGNADGSSDPVQQGAGVAVTGGSLTLTDCVFVDNIAKERGAGFYGVTVDVTATRCSFSSNVLTAANARGGGVYVLGGKFEAVESEFVANVADATSQAGTPKSGAAAIYTAGQAGLRLELCLIRENRGRAAAVFAESPAATKTIEIHACEFILNTGTDGDCAAFTAANAPAEDQVIVSQCTFDANGGSASTGAVELLSSHATVDDCTFTSNVARSTGGLHSTSSILLVRDTTFVANFALIHSGGAADISGGVPYVSRFERCWFELNAADDGGAISLSSSAAIVDCVFINNSANSSGGAIASPSSGGAGPPVSLERCLFLSNTAFGNGGAVRSTATPLSAKDCVFSGNSAINGGAIYSGLKDIHVERCSLVGNQAFVAGGGLAQATGTVTVSGSILWNNTVGGVADFNGQIATNLPGAAPATLSFWQSCVQSLPPKFDVLGGISADPAFVDADGPDDTPGTLDDDFRLLATSPCINRGDPTFTDSKKVDLAGEARVQQCRVDMGAIESPFEPAAAADCDGDGISDACEILDGQDGDCNEDGVPDSCEIAAGADDCDANGIPDSCELGLQQFTTQSAPQSPFGAGFPLSLTFANPGAAQSDVLISLTARGDFSAAQEFVSVLANGVSVGTLFVTGGDCTHEPQLQTLILAKNSWNTLVAAGSVLLQCQASADVNPAACAETVAVASISFLIAPTADANSDGILDACQFPADLDGDGLVGPVDLGILLGAWGPCDRCNADVDGDGLVGPADLGVLLGAWSGG
ncbi:MAG: hypothetical protein JNM94_14970 [Phycisphaerae bacterium]|nr:hypothetical protein [Phycisphaerae bacterium]